MDDDQQFCLRWNNHQSTLISVFDTLLENGTLVDCTLAAEGKFLKAHKVVLSACSPYFAALLQEQYDKHPIFILKDVKFQELRAMMDYMYRGEVNISQDQLAALLKAAESLQIKGLSDNRTGAAPRPDHHRGMNVPASNVSGATAVSGSGKMSGGYTLEQTKRARIGAAAMDTQEMSGSREGSSSPTRRRRKVRRRSIENAMTEVHDNSNSSQQPNLQQSNANLAGVGAITAAASVLASQQQPISGAALPTGSGGVATATQGTTQQLTTNVTKKTESVKVTSDAMNTENVQQTLGGDEQDMEHIAAVKIDKQNHKQKLAASASSTAAGKDASDLVIEPKSEYDEDGNDETVEDLTLDDEDMGMDDLDQNAGTSQGGEGSSQGYATWQHDRSQDELLLATQEAQQRDPQDENAAAGARSTVIEATGDGQTPAQTSESRIRVRNWLMMADQSILQKSIKDNGSEKLTKTNAATNTAAPVTSKSTATQSIDASTSTMTRIGSIGRTTIACITPSDGNNTLNNGNVSAMSAAALAAAGVELDSIDENMTEVIVKIENSNSSAYNDDEEEEEECEEEEDDENDMDDEPQNEDGSTQNFNYNLKLSSPMPWALDTVKIEQEEFEDMVSIENDNTEDDDDLLTTAAATTKQASVLTRSSGLSKGANTKKRLQQSPQQLQQIQQQQQMLLEQQQHLQHLNLQPNRPTMQIKLPSIPATITSIAPKPSTTTTAGALNISGALTDHSVFSSSNKNSDFQASLSEDKRYRILIQNQRMRKESLEHSADMIYNADIEKPWVCRNCNRNYKWKNSLKCHLKNECGQPPRYYCSKLCGYRTNVHSNLKRHLNTKCRDRIDEETKSTNFTVITQKNE